MSWQRRRLCLGLGAWALAPAGVRAQADWSRVAVPSYAPGDLVQGLYRHWALPRADEFAAQGRQLQAALQTLCSAPLAEAQPALQAARRQWQATLLAWERLSALALGPLLERRSARQLDFMPTRPASIERAIQAAPEGPAAMERIGAPAKGLPALEWLLWRRPLQPGTPACRYAAELAAEIGREALALQAAFALAVQQERDEEAVAAAFEEALNQWVGALERLRWTQIEKPLRAAEGVARAIPDWPRGASNSSAAGWAAQWEALRAFAVLPHDTAAPAPGAGLVPLETYLRGRGLNGPADALVQAAARVDREIRRLDTRDRASLWAAAQALAALQRLTEAQLAPALQVRLGFSDADGD